jgi:hypothetical protein
MSLLEFRSPQENEMRILRRHAPVAALAVGMLLGVACSKAPVEMKFATPEAAATALLQALKNNDSAKLEAMFGRDVMQEVASGDPTSDRHDRQIIALAMEQSQRWIPLDPERSELIIGDERWPFPAPLVKTGSEWRFDGNAAKEEVLVRRIGRNELNVISLCHAYVGMQREYAGESRDGKPAGLFAKQLRSSPGRHDGLYWPRTAGTSRSPLGDLAAKATAEGYDVNKASATPLWGYVYKILTAQGDAAPGGRKSYVVNGDMSGGFALIAFPAKYASSGVMTFIVNQDGVVYEKDLGLETQNLASSATEYNPDASWTRVRLPGAGALETQAASLPASKVN